MPIPSGDSLDRGDMEALAESIARRLFDYLAPEIRRSTCAILNGIAKSTGNYSDMCGVEEVYESYKNGGDGERQ